LKQAGGEKYYSLERNAEFAHVMTSLIDIAGLSSIVEVIVGPSSDSLRKLHADGVLSHIDMMFIDHYKPAYLPDLKLCEELGLVGQGTVLAADNVIKPGNPPYLEYVRSSVETKKKKAAQASGTNGTESFTDRYSKQYAKREGAEHLDTELRGDPLLVYQSELIESFEPTGVPVSKSLTSPPIHTDS
jgi:catechol O-methyltransferase